MVCMGNVCRSPMAQQVTVALAHKAGLGSDVISVDSAGTRVGGGGAPIDPRARALLSQNGYPVGRGRARQIVDKDFAACAMVLAMDQSNMNDLRRLCPGEHVHKLRLLMEFAPGAGALDIPDPYYGSVQGFERVLALCEAGARGLVEHLKTLPR